MAEDHKSVQITLDYIKKDITEMKAEVKDIRTLLQHEYVTKEFLDLKIAPMHQKVSRHDKIIWAVLMAILLGILSAGLSTILK